MRPVANFTLHAILAACLAALAASSAAAGGPVIDNEGHAFLTGNLLGGSAAKGGGQQLEVDSWQWGSPNRAYLKYKLSPAFVKSWSTSGDADAPPPPGGGQYRTLRPRPVDAPPPRLGALTVLARSIPCHVGARYPSLSFTGKGKTWLLQDVEVADCGAAAGPTEEITFVYGKVTVKGWDPKKKE